MTGLDEMVDIPTLLVKGGLVDTRAQGTRAVCSGAVYIQKWNIGVPEMTLPRWVLRGVTIRVGSGSLHVSDDGRRLRRSEPAAVLS